ncbi:MAG TPA: hypothetical protein VK960_07160 [Acidimicrobiia bacterium]|nr:hypothetical protein [Acidimicrobiia bacterium]
MIRRIVIGLLSLVVAVSACGGDDGEFGQDLRASLMESCTEEQSESYCVCYLEELQERFTQEQIFRVVIEGREEPPPEFLEAALACAAELDR